MQQLQKEEPISPTTFDTSFETLGLAPEILRSLRDLGYVTPTPIQEKAIPVLLAGHDLMGCAQTGTGKTAAFALPILQQLRGTRPGHLKALVLVPTRELAIQVGKNIREYAQHMDLRTAAVYGGVPIAPQEMVLRYGVDILVATPGRLKDHMWRGLIDFRETRFLVLDEADRMLDMGFIDAVREIVREIPPERQSMLFSATLEPEIRRLAKDMLKNPVRVEVSPPTTVADGIEHLILPAGAGEKRKILDRLLVEHSMSRALVFARTRRGAHQLSITLKRQGHQVSSIHSDKSQSQRTAALEAFREGRIKILVATDIAARGLDVDGISHVINYDFPRSAEDYVHRIGRTARAGRKGLAISLVTSEDYGCLRDVERIVGRPLLGQRPAAEQAPAPWQASSSRRAPRQAPATRPASGKAPTSRRAPATRPEGGLGRSQGAPRRRRAPIERTSRAPRRISEGEMTRHAARSMARPMQRQNEGFLRKMIHRLGLAPSSA